MNLASIVIPSYNSEAYIKEAVDSALAQTYQNCEVIVVDDGSTDRTREILDPYITANKIIYIYQANKGLAGARNTGIRAAKGEYIAFLDSDDMFMPEKIAKQVAALEAHPDFGICYCDLIHFYDTEPPARLASQPASDAPRGDQGESVAGRRKYFHHRYSYISGNLLPAILHKQFVNPLTLVIRHEVCEKFGTFDETFHRSEDWDLWLRWAHAGVKFYYLDELLAYYRVQTGGNLSSLSSEPAMKEKNLELFERFGKTLTEHERKEYHFQKILNRLMRKVAFAYLMVGKKSEALEKAKTLSLHLQVVIAIIPEIIWVWVLGRWREVKHRMLLKKM